jgi:hypothetical protein
MNKISIKRLTISNSKACIPVKGGLGNQMFFYAFSLLLQKKNIDTELLWNEYVFTKQHNGVELFHTFNIKVEVRSKRTISFYLFLNNSPIPFITKRLISRIFGLKYKFYLHHIQGSPYSYDESIFFQKNKTIVYDGFWQNWNYLKEVENEIREKFIFNLPVGFEKNIFLEKILSSNAVSIHIRRGDYLLDEFSELHVINSLNYYFDAIQYCKEKIPSPIFFIFSDDIPWAKQNFQDNDFVFIEGNNKKDAYLDMFLMSQCNHNIISNSTFSFWGAWLNQHNSKIVIAPNLWTKTVLSRTLCPPSWTFLEV